MLHFTVDSPFLSVPKDIMGSVFLKNHHCWALIFKDGQTIKINRHIFFSFQSAMYLQNYAPF